MEWKILQVFPRPTYSVVFLLHMHAEWDATAINDIHASVMLFVL